jgi:hypothetical protein
MSDLQLNEPRIEYFEGRNVDKMQELIAKGMTPLSVSGLMQRRLQAQYGSESVRNSLMNNYHDTGDGIAYHPDGRIKIVPDANPLREMNPESRLVNGALVLPDGMYEKLEGHEFTRKDIQKYVGDSISSKDAKSNPLWQALARDPKLLNEYVDLIFAQAKQQFDYDKNMGVYVKDASDVPKDAATMRPWFVGRLEDRSGAYGGDVLVSSYGLKTATTYGAISQHKTIKCRHKHQRSFGQKATNTLHAVHFFIQIPFNLTATLPLISQKGVNKLNYLGVNNRVGIFCMLNYLSLFY